MKKRREFLFIFVIIAVIGIMILYSVSKDAYQVKDQDTEGIRFNQSQRTYLKQQDTVYLAVPENLQYLNRGFLEEYMNDLAAPSGMTIKLTEKENQETQGRIAIVTDKLRKQVDQYHFTTPILQIKGGMFIDQKSSKSSLKQLKGIAIKGQLNEKKPLSYNEKPVEITTTDTVKHMIRIAKETDKDCMIGDQAAVVDELKAQGLEDRYENTGRDLYKENVCIIIKAEDTDLYQILNQCIQNADKHVLASRAQGHWYGIPAALAEDGRYSDAAILLIIVFAAVFCAFFFYYQSNKNLYNELTDRMDQLTASKQEMQTTFNGVSYYMAELDPDGMIVDINEAFLKYVKTEPMGRHITEVLELPEELEAVIREGIETTKRSGKGNLKELALKRVILEVNIFPIRSAKGEVEKLLFMASDITGERMAERQLLQDNKMIAVGQLAAGVAHEIRNPLGLIRNYCYVLKNMEDEEAKAQAIQIIEKSVDTSNKIIDNLLNFSRRSDQHLEKVQIKQHIDSVLSLNTGMFKKKDILVSVECEADFQVYLALESFDMIFINLLSNAVDAMDKKGRLSIGIERGEDDFTLKVSDTGSGIEKEIMDEIFNPFFTTKSNTEGNGLGLYIVYNEVKKRNGSIDVDSEMGRGTTFKINLPIAAEEEKRG